MSVTRLFIVEIRRLLPIGVLLVMLLAVSVYDGFTRNAVPTVNLPNPVPYKTLEQGSLSGTPGMIVVTTQDMWVAAHRSLGQELINYEFKPDTQTAIFLVNCQLRATTLTDDSRVGLVVLARSNTWQLIIFERTHLPQGGTNVVFELVKDSE